MIPRSVLQRKQGNRKSVQKPVYRSQAEDSIQNGFAKNTEVNILATGPGTGKNACDTLRETVVKDVLCDILDLCSSTNNVTINQPAAGYRPVSVSNAIRRQRNPPLVDVGPLASTNKVPVYSRSRGPAPNKSASTSVCKGLAWEPNKRYSSRPKSQGERQTDYHGRRWEYSEKGKYYLQRPDHHQGFTFTVMSYNVLAQELLEQHREMYYGSWDVLGWKSRKRKLLQEIKVHMPDVVCLQEVQNNHYTEFFLPELQALGYDGAYLKRTQGKVDGCATFHKLKTFHVEETIEVPYLHKHGGDVLNRDNVALIVKLKAQSQSVAGSKTLVVANTHLLFNPRRGDIKLAQLMMLFAEIDKCACLDSSGPVPIYQPVVICGDFNSVPHSELYKFVIMGYLEYEGILCREVSGQETDYRSGPLKYLTQDFMPRDVGISDNCHYCQIAQDRGKVANAEALTLTEPQGLGMLRHNLRLVSVYEHWCRRRGHYYPEVSTHHGKSNCTVDYIFYGVLSGLVRFHEDQVQTKDVQEGNLTLLGRYGLLTDSELGRMGSLPNRYFGSDHLALIAKFLFT